MRRSIVFGFIAACAFALPAIAQDKPAPKEHTMTGCLRAGTEAGTFIVENTAEKGPKTIGIVSSKANLKPHVGHKIDITGTAIPEAAAQKAKPKPSKAPHYMNITAIKMVSTACP